jgi:hypothetical protein
MVVCALLVIAFAVNAWLAVSTKCATFDEVAHAPAAYTHLRLNDFRMNPEHPPLWKYWAAVPWLFDPPADVRLTDPEFARTPNAWIWSQNLLYRTPANDGTHLIAMSRMSMLFIGIALLVLGAVFAWRIAGPVAAMITTALLAFDPNLLAHSPLVTNDVSFAVVSLAIVFCLWRCSQALSRARIATLCLLCAAAITTKFNGVLFAPIVVLVLLVRAIAPSTWRLGTRELASRSSRILAAVGVCVACAIASWVLLWAAYGFRYTPSSDLSIRPDFDGQVRQALINRIHSRSGALATSQQIADEPIGLTVSILRFAETNELLPEAFLSGMLFVYANSFNRLSFFLGNATGGGNPLYFPVAMAVKTPLSTLLLVFAAIGSALFIRTHRERTKVSASDEPGEGAKRQRPADWFWPSLLVPMIVLLITSIFSPLNIGLRHILPVYPLAYVAVGVLLARCVAIYRRAAWVIVGLLVLLAVETCCVFPNYLAYFNLAAGGSRGGAKLLGDSNIDWGQDLPLLARWQQAHPDRVLYLAYFGMADPAYYGIRANILALGSDYSQPMPTPPTTGVVAASVSMLQAKHRHPETAAFYKSLRDREPDEVLGGSIYLFDLDGKR